MSWSYGLLQSVMIWKRWRHGPPKHWYPTTSLQCHDSEDHDLNDNEPSDFINLHAVISC